MSGCGCRPGPSEAGSSRAPTTASPSVAVDPCLPPEPITLAPELPPREALRGSLLDGAPLPPGAYRDRVKCTVSRLTNLLLSITTGVQRWRFTLTAEEQQRHLSTDAAFGLLFVRIQADPQIVIATIRVFWEVPGSPFEWLEQQAVVPLNETFKLPAWSSPHPGRVTVEVEIDNSGPPSTAHVLLDVLARRRGLAFRRGHLLRDDATFHHEPPLADDFDPEPELGIYIPPLPSRPPCAPSPPRASSDCSCDDGIFVGEPRAIDHCLPDPNVMDWESPHGDDEVDPEVEMGLDNGFDIRKLTYEKFDGRDARYQKTLNRSGRVGILGDLGFDAERHARWLFETSDTALTRHLWRCNPFTETWQKVTMGLERDRLPLADLDDIVLPGPMGYPGEERRRSERLSDLAADDDGDVNAWQWTVTAPWLSPRYRITWFFTELVNLLHATRQYIPSRQRVDVENGDTKTISIEHALSSIRGERSWTLRLRRSGSSRRDLREILRTPPSGAIGLDRGSLRTHDVKENYATGKAFPHTKRIRIHGGFLGAHLIPAQALYTIARQIVMAAVHAPTDEEREALVVHAGNVYRAYLGTLLPVAKTLLHELIHFDYGSHCRAGCAHERIAARWLRRVGVEHRPGWTLMTTDSFVPRIVALPNVDWRGDIEADDANRCPSFNVNDADWRHALCKYRAFYPLALSRNSKCKSNNHYWVWLINRFGDTGDQANQLYGFAIDFSKPESDRASRGFRRKCTND